MGSRRWMAILIAALSVDVALSLIIRFEDLHRFSRGDRDLGTVLAVIGLGWLVVVLMAAAGVARSLLAVRGAVFRRDQAIAAAAATSKDWLWEADTCHRITYSSDGVRELLGYEPQDLIGRSTLTLLADDDVGRAERLLQHALGSHSGWDAVEVTWRHADGSPVVLRGSAAPILDENGGIVGFRGTRRRVTAAMAAEHALAAAKARLTSVLTDRDLEIALQPIVDPGSGLAVGAEALARFRDGRGPDEWFRDARDTGLALDLDRLTFTTALNLLPQIPKHLYLSINASPELIIGSLALTDLLAADVPLDRLVIEVTEHVRIGDYQQLHDVLTPLREHGVRLAIDDTGAGYASLAHVLQLRPDIIKIDRSLIASISTDPARRSLVTALVLMALDLGATVTGEGVETPTELETLATLGVDHVQGYLLGKPETDPHRWVKWWTRNWLQPTGKQMPRARIR